MLPHGFSAWGVHLFYWVAPKNLKRFYKEKQHVVYIPYVEIPQMSVGRQGPPQCLGPRRGQTLFTEPVSGYHSMKTLCYHFLSRFPNPVLAQMRSSTTT